MLVVDIYVTVRADCFWGTDRARLRQACQGIWLQVSCIAQCSTSTAGVNQPNCAITSTACAGHWPRGCLQNQPRYLCIAHCSAAGRVPMTSPLGPFLFQNFEQNSTCKHQLTGPTAAATDQGVAGNAGDTVLRIVAATTTFHSTVCTQAGGHMVGCPYWWSRPPGCIYIVHKAQLCVLSCMCTWAYVHIMVRPTSRPIRLMRTPL